MFYAKKITELSEQLEKVTGAYSAVNERLADITSELEAATADNDTLRNKIADYEAQIQALNKQHIEAVEAIKAETKTAIEEGVTEGVISLASSVGVDPIANNPDAETVANIGEQYAQISNPIERAHFLKAYGSQLLKAAGSVK